MRVSDIGNWAACEAMALGSPPREAGRTNVAAAVGTLAHGMLADEGMSLDGQHIAFDALTPSMHHLVTQAGAIATKARELLTDQGWGVLGARRRTAARRTDRASWTSARITQESRRSDH